MNPPISRFRTDLFRFSKKLTPHEVQGICPKVETTNNKMYITRNAATLFLPDTFLGTKDDSTKSTSFLVCLAYLNVLKIKITKPSTRITTFPNI